MQNHKKRPYGVGSTLMVSLIIRKRFLQLLFNREPVKYYFAGFLRWGVPNPEGKGGEKRDQDNFLGPKLHIFKIAYLHIILTTYPATWLNRVNAHKSYMLQNRFFLVLLCSKFLSLRKI